MIFSFFVPGIPVPKGSAKAFLHRHSGKIITRQDNAERQKPWASSIGHTAIMSGVLPVDAPVKINLKFVMPRIKKHFGTGKKRALLREDAPFWHVTKPDLDKLVRCVKDALTGVAWQDDSQVSVVEAYKAYGEFTGVQIRIETL